MNQSTASLGLAQPRSSRLIRYALPAALLVALVAGFFGYQAWIARPPASTAAASQVVSAAELEEQYGLRVELIGVTAAGGMVDFRLKVLDAAKAKPWLPEHIPSLWVDQAGALLTAPGDSPAEDLKLEDGGMVLMLFPNVRNAVKPGSRVTVMFGDLRLEPIVAQ